MQEKGSENDFAFALKRQMCVCGLMLKREGWVIRRERPGLPGQAIGCVTRADAQSGGRWASIVRINFQHLNLVPSSDGTHKKRGYSRIFRRLLFSLWQISSRASQPMGYRTHAFALEIFSRQTKRIHRQSFFTFCSWFFVRFSSKAGRSAHSGFPLLRTKLHIITTLSLPSRALCSLSLLCLSTHSFHRD